MSFAFKRKECIAEGVCRIARRQVAKALKSCSKNAAESIHDTRKQIKKLRALLRVVRCGVGKKQFEKALKDLREAAAYLAAPRDSHVQLNALEKLNRPPDRKSSNDPFSRMRAALKEESREQTVRFRANRQGRKVREILRKTPPKFQRLHFNKDGWDILGPAIKNLYDGAQAARDCVRKDGTPENFHEWRKRTKDLFYSIKLVEPIWPEQISAISAEFEKLTEFLGDDHDLEMLRQTAVKKSVSVELEGDTQRLLPLIENRQLELRKSALKLGSRLFEETPSKFSGRLHQYWKRWKSKKHKLLEPLAAA
jgi:CHAD domain-containing protein